MPPANIPTRLLAETLLRDVNSAEQAYRRDKRSMAEVQKRLDQSTARLKVVLEESARQGLLFDYSEQTGVRSLVPPVLGWADERGGRIVELGK